MGLIINLGRKSNCRKALSAIKQSIIGIRKSNCRITLSAIKQSNPTSQKIKRVNPNLHGPENQPKTKIKVQENTFCNKTINPRNQEIPMENNPAEENLDTRNVGNNMKRKREPESTAQHTTKQTKNNQASDNLTGNNNPTAYAEPKNLAKTIKHKNKPTRQKESENITNRRRNWLQPGHPLYARFSHLTSQVTEPATPPVQNPALVNPQQQLQPHGPPMLARGSLQRSGSPLQPEDGP